MALRSKLNMKPSRVGRSVGSKAPVPSSGYQAEEEVTSAEQQARVMGVPVSSILGMGRGRGGAMLLRRNSLVIQGSPLAGVAAPGGGVDSPQLNWQVSEAAWLHKLLLTGANDADLNLTALRHINDNLISGFVPASVFDPDGYFNPLAGRWANVNAPLNVVLRKTSAGAVTYFPAWSTATTRQAGANPRGFVRPSISGVGGRSLLAIGAQQAYTIAAGGNVVLNFPVQEEGVIDKLILEVEAAAALAQVVNITYDNDPLLPQQSAVPAGLFSNFSWNNPTIGFYVEVGHFLQVELRSLAGAAGPWRVAGAFTVR